MEGLLSRSETYKWQGPFSFHLGRKYGGVTGRAPAVGWGRGAAAPRPDPVLAVQECSLCDRSPGCQLRIRALSSPSVIIQYRVRSVNKDRWMDTKTSDVSDGHRVLAVPSPLRLCV